METDYESVCAMFILDDDAGSPLPATLIVMWGNPGKLTNQLASLPGLPSNIARGDDVSQRFEVKGVKIWPVLIQ